MQRYLNHLLADVEAATRNAPAASTYRFRHPFDDDDEREGPALQLRYVGLSELFGLASGIFPPAERLTKDQITTLLSAIEALWRAWNVEWDCPPRLTARRRYTVMIERMEHEPVQYNHEFGASVDFCEHRADGICPFSDRSQCWCDELDACARQDMEIWESARDLNDNIETPASPLLDFHRWTNKDRSAIPPWELDESRDRWQQFFNDDEALAWLYFFDPLRASELHNETPEPSPEDFEDFDWFSDPDEDSGTILPF